MAVERFEDRLLGRLAALGEVTSRHLFGGHGVYWGGTIFGIVYRGRLYLKVDEDSKGVYLARGMGPLRASERQTLRTYYEVPPEVFDNLDELLSWAGEAIRLAMASRGPAR